MGGRAQDGLPGCGPARNDALIAEVMSCRLAYEASFMGRAFLEIFLKHVVLLAETLRPCGGLGDLWKAGDAVDLRSGVS